MMSFRSVIVPKDDCTKEDLRPRHDNDLCVEHVRFCAVVSDCAVHPQARTERACVFPSVRFFRLHRFHDGSKYF